MWAIIGGSGFGKFDGVTPLEDLDRSTPFGLASSGLKKIKVNNTECIFLPRHGESHENLPSEVNYRANIYALKKHGATSVLAFSAVGSLQAELKPGDMVIVDQYMDRTKSLRKHTFAGEGFVSHVSMADPTCPSWRKIVKDIRPELNFDVHFDKTYLCIEGPSFSTRAESVYYQKLGADIIGMTQVPESGLAREAGLCYLSCCFVTDFDCWNTEIPHVTVEEVMETMKKNNLKAFEVAQKLLKQDQRPPCDCKTSGISSGLMTPWDKVPESAQTWLKTLMD